MSRTTLARFAVALGLALPAALVAADAGACGSAVRFEIDSRTQNVARAERSLSDGQNAAAARIAVQAFPAIHEETTGSALLSRAQRILALAIARLDGRWSSGSAFLAATADQRHANLEWAVSTLRHLNEQRPNEASLQTDLGEALAKLPKYQAEAARLLGDLADRDVLASAQGYAALARIRAAAGDATGREDALKRCQAMTSSQAVCAAPAAVTPRST